MDLVRIGNAHGFWGDRLEAAAEMLAREPDLDFLTLDFLAEVSMSLLAQQRSRDPQAGWPQDFVEIVRSIAPYWRRGGRCRIITNAGGLNPRGCAQACQAALQATGCSDRSVAVVSGDDVLELVQADHSLDESLRNLDTGQPIAAVRDRLVTANAYLGSVPIARALAGGADLVLTGRVADPSLTVSACAHRFGWRWDAWDCLAGATVAGHLIECGTQVTGGIATDWLTMPALDRIGFPIVEVARDGSCVVTKPQGTGGRVCLRTVKEQLVYEIGNPDEYLSPDVTVSLLSLHVDDEGGDRVRISGARGRPAPGTLKVSATYQDGFRAQGQLTIFGPHAVTKAQRAAQAVLDRLRAAGHAPRQWVVECLGAGACRPQGGDPALAAELTEVVLRIAVTDDSRAMLEHFAHELMPLVTAGPQGTTGYAEGRPRIHPLFRFWPALIPCDRVRPQIEVDVDLPAPRDAITRGRVGRAQRAPPIGPEELVGLAALDPPYKIHEIELLPGRGPLPVEPALAASDEPPENPPRRLSDIAYARSGDKGIHANIGVIARRAADFGRLCREVTAARVAAYFGLADAGQVIRYEWPNLGALNLVLHGILANPLRADAQGKALGQVLLEMPLSACLESALSASLARAAGEGGEERAG